MKTISDEIRQIILSQPYLEEALTRGIINYSALAREIRPQIEKELFKDLSDSAVMMAIKRLAERLPDRLKPIEKHVRNMMRMTVRSDLLEYTYPSNGRIMTSISMITSKIQNPAMEFFTFSLGSHEVTMIFSRNMKATVDQTIQANRPNVILEHLSTISINLPEETVTTPGIHYAILKQLAWNRINVVEVVSTYTEFTIVLASKDIDKAFSILMSYFQGG